MSPKEMLAALVLLAAVASCASYTVDNAHAAADYSAAQAACVDKAKTKAEADACRCAVKQQFNRPCPDGGAP